MQSSIHSTGKQQQPNSGRSARRTWVYLLIALLLLILIWAIFTMYRVPDNVSTTAHLQNSALKYTTYRSETGQRKQLQLPDGTKVILNSRSTLLVPENFAQQHGELVLDGEAFFEVAAATRPFVVKTEILTATVLGTAFRIRSFTSQAGATLYLLNGKVKVTKSYHSTTDNQPEILERGQMVLANKDIDLMEKETFEPAELEAWLQERLRFEQTPLPAAIRQLEEWYAVDISLEGDFSKAGPLNGTFDHYPLQKMLDTLSARAGCRYKIRDQAVSIRF